MKIWSTFAALLVLFHQPAIAAEVPVPDTAYGAQRVMETAGFQMIGRSCHDRST